MHREITYWFRKYQKTPTFRISVFLLCSLMAILILHLFPEKTFSGPPIRALVSSTGASLSTIDMGIFGEYLSELPKGAVKCQDFFTNKYSDGYIILSGEMPCTLEVNLCLGFVHLIANYCTTDPSTGASILIHYSCLPEVKGRQVYKAEKINCPNGCRFHKTSGVCIL